MKLVPTNYDIPSSVELPELGRVLGTQAYNLQVGDTVVKAANIFWQVIHSKDIDDNSREITVKEMVIEPFGGLKTFDKAVVMPHDEIVARPKDELEADKVYAIETLELIGYEVIENLPTDFGSALTVSKAGQEHTLIYNHYGQELANVPAYM